jgi:peptidyl-dipeptidase A
MTLAHRRFVAAWLGLSLFACSGSCSSAGPQGRADASRAAGETRSRAATFLAGYEREFQRLSGLANEAEWTQQTHIVEGDTTNQERTQAAKGELARFTGSAEVIEAARELLAEKRQLEPVQVRQLEAVLFAAASNPQTVPELVTRRIAAEAAQTERMYGFEYTLGGQPITPNEIDQALRSERDLGRRQAVWEASKAVGPALKPGLVELVGLRNATVRALGYPDFFSYMVSEYGMTTAEMAALVDALNRDLRPLFTELHTWARHELARRFGQSVPDLLPAHWLPNRWGQDWSALVDVPGFDLDAALGRKDAEWLVKQAERFYVSLGFEPLPPVFWQRSSLYPVPKDAGYQKNTHASAWHIDLDRDVRSLMSVEPNTEWYETTHHELGHVYYYLCYARAEVPVLLRQGANRAYHEAVGSLMGLAAMQPRFVAATGLELPPSAAKADPMQLLLKEALNYVVFIPWSAGTMFHFEKDLYVGGLEPARWNRRWWELAARYQGIAPPLPRGEEWCDGATKTHVNDDPAGYYDYALSFVILFQLHDHISRKVLGQDPRDTNYFARREVGDFLRPILACGSNVDWRTALKEATGSGLSSAAMVRYFEPLLAWLKTQNAGRRATLPAL